MGRGGHQYLPAHPWQSLIGHRCIAEFLFVGLGEGNPFANFPAHGLRLLHHGHCTVIFTLDDEFVTPLDLSGTARTSQASSGLCHADHGHILDDGFSVSTAAQSGMRLSPGSFRK